MSRMQRYVSIISLLLLLSVATGNAYALVPEQPDEDYVTASVMVTSPGDALYSKLGHAFFRMQCPTHNMDFCFTYESDDAVNKVAEFLSGNLKMGMMGIPTDEFLKSYQNEGREVTEYTLDLPIAVKQNLWRILDGYVDEGMMLPYDYMERGCAYSVFSMLNEASQPGSLTIASWPEDFWMSRRELVCSQLDDSPWTKLFLNIITNGPIDDNVSNDEKIITPLHLEQTLRLARYDGHPLVKGEGKKILSLTKEDSPSPWLTPMKLAAAILILTTICAAFGKPWMIYALLGLQTLLGLFVGYLLLISTLCATEWSWLIIPFNPLPLFFWKWRRYWESVYAGLLILWVALITFGGSYLMDPPLIILALSLGIAYFGDELRRRNLYFQLNILKPQTKTPFNKKC